MNRMGTAWILVCAAALAGCGDTGGGASSAAPSSSAAAAPMKSSKPAMSAPPAASTAMATPPPSASAASATCAPKGPFESITFKSTDAKTDKGWPKFHTTNVGDKTIVFAVISGYAYDKDGKQVFKTKTPLSWNGSLKCGESSTFDTEVGSMDEKVPATATQFELCYDEIKFDGDAKAAEDKKACGDKRPLGGNPVAPAASASAAASAMAPPKGAPPAPTKK